MTPKKPQTKTLLFSDPATGEPDSEIVVVTVGAPKIVRWSNSIDLRGEDDKTIATVTWPSRYRIREV